MITPKCGYYHLTQSEEENKLREVEGVRDLGGREEEERKGQGQFKYGRKLGRRTEAQNLKGGM